MPTLGSKWRLWFFTPKKMKIPGLLQVTWLSTWSYLKLLEILGFLRIWCSHQQQLVVEPPLNRALLVSVGGYGIGAAGRWRNPTCSNQQWWTQILHHPIQRGQIPFCKWEKFIPHLQNRITHQRYHQPTDLSACQCLLVHFLWQHETMCGTVIHGPVALYLLLGGDKRWASQRNVEKTLFKWELVWESFVGQRQLVLLGYSNWDDQTATSFASQLFIINHETTSVATNWAMMMNGVKMFLRRSTRTQGVGSVARPNLPCHQRPPILFDILKNPSPWVFWVPSLPILAKARAASAGWR